MLDAELDERLDSESESRNSLRLWLHLIKCAKQLEQKMADRLRSTHDCSFSRFDVLAHLFQAGPAGLNTSVLATHLLASKGNITRLLDRMEQDGLLDRKLSAMDRRVSKIYLSAKGADLFRRMEADHEAWAYELFSMTSVDEREELLRLLKKIKAPLA